MANLSSFYPQPVVAGTTEGTFAEGDDARIVGAATKAWVAGVTKNVYLSARTDGVAGSGTQVDPYDVSTAAKWFSVIPTIPNYSHIHILAGNYSVVGLGPLQGAFWPDGCSVSGEGIDKTILTVTEVTDDWTYGAYNVIPIWGYRQGGVGNPYITGPRQRGCFVQDLTIDCNWSNLKAVDKKCGAIHIIGIEKNSIRRVKVTNFGGHASSNPNPQESFPLIVEGDNAVVEDCIIENPEKGIGDNLPYATFISVGGGISTWQQTNRTITGNASTNIFNQNQRYSNGDKFIFTQITGGSPLVANKIYYVVNVDQNSSSVYPSGLPASSSFQLSETPNGTAIDFDAFSNAQGGGLFQFNKATVRGNIFRGKSALDRGGFGCILGSGYKSLTIENNTFQNLQIGCYGDSWNCGSVHIKNNWFNNCQRGISAEMGLQIEAQIEDFVVTDNLFDAYGGNSGVGDQPNQNFIGGWCLRTTRRINRLIFERNRIQPLDNREILEGSPLTLDCTEVILRDNMVHSLVGRANDAPAKSRTIDEGNLDESGIVRWLQPWNLSHLELRGLAGEQVSFTASASTDIVTTSGYTNFKEGEFVYFYNLTGGSGLSSDTRYFVRDIVTNALTKVQTFKVYTTKTGGSPVDITVNYTSASMISNREYKNGKCLEVACDTLKSMITNMQSSFYQPQTATLFLYPAIYEHESSGAAPSVGNFPLNTKIVGIGHNRDIIIRKHGGPAIDLGFGNGANSYLENLHLQSWAANSSSIVFGSGQNNQLINVHFSIGAGATRCVGIGSSGLGTGNYFESCTSSDPMYDPSANQGTANTCTFVRCSFTNGFCPNSQSCTFQDSTIKLLLNLSIGSGGIDKCLIENAGVGTNTRIIADGAKITDSKIKNLWIEPSNNNETYIANTTIEPLAGTTYAIGKFGSPAIVKLSNVAMSKLIDSNITVTSLNLFNQTAFLSGIGAPSASAPNGSLYLRTDGDASTTLYVRAGGTWKPLSSYES